MISLQNFIKFYAHFHHPQNPSILSKDRPKNTKEKIKNHSFTNFGKIIRGITDNGPVY